MNPRWFFAFFFVSGACSLVYEVVWLRLAMAGFGVTTPLVAIVLSVFMAGLAIGSWGAGGLVRRLRGEGPATALRAYALTEVMIGLSALLVPVALRAGRGMFERWVGDAGWASSSHYLASGVFLTLVFLPFSTAMGATFPLGMEAIRRTSAEAAERSFSYLYLANVLGAATGTLVSALVLIELLGFRGTLLLTGASNGVLAVIAFALARTARGARSGTPRRSQPTAARSAGAREISAGAAGWLLFAGGLLSMGMEIVWVRQFTPFLGTVVYAFAAILASYLGATFLGSVVYRRWTGRRAAGSGGADPGVVCALAALAALLPLAFADPRGTTATKDLAAGIVRVALGIGPFCLAMGFLTPMLVDRWSRGDPRVAGRAYALNVLGCIAGPLLAGFVLLPHLGERGSLVVLALPLLGAGAAFAAARAPSGTRRESPSVRWRATVAALALGGPLALLTRDYETLFPRREVRRDDTATVIATGEGFRKQLLVNGYGMTVLTPITKVMAHLPLVFRASPPRNALVICFGMGTSFRSALSWGIPTTAVELIPSVPSLFGYFHADAAAVAALPGARIVIDDGRRFLERTPDLYDMITVDPPPPVAAAGSSLLYSKEFFATVRSRLAPGGILQAWFPGEERIVACAIARAIGESFPHVRVFRSHQDWGFHFLASAEPIPQATAAELATRMPPRAAADLVEWEPAVRPAERLEQLVRREISFAALVNLVPDAPILEDDRPVNEYYLVRHAFGGPAAP